MQPGQFCRFLRSCHVRGRSPASRRGVFGHPKRPFRRSRFRSLRFLLSAVSGLRPGSAPRSSIRRVFPGLSPRRGLRLCPGCAPVVLLLCGQRPDFPAFRGRRPHGSGDLVRAPGPPQRHVSGTGENGCEAPTGCRRHPSADLGRMRKSCRARLYKKPLSWFFVACTLTANGDSTSQRFGYLEQFRRQRRGCCGVSAWNADVDFRVGAEP